MIGRNIIARPNINISEYSRLLSLKTPFTQVKFQFVHNDKVYMSAASQTSKPFFYPTSFKLQPTTETLLDKIHKGPCGTSSYRTNDHHLQALQDLSLCSTIIT